MLCWCGLCGVCSWPSVGCLAPRLWSGLWEWFGEDVKYDGPRKHDFTELSLLKKGPRPGGTFLGSLQLSHRGGSSMQCTFCRKPLELKSAWQGAHSQFYCGEFCADSEVSGSTAAPPSASLLQHHITQPYERLERLLPYMRLYAGQALPSAHR